MSPSRSVWPALVLLMALEAHAAPGPSPSGADPVSAVRAVFAALVDRSVPAFIAWMTEDYRFDSDDGSFRAGFPAGMTREDERRFVSHLLAADERATDGDPRHGVTVDTTLGPMVVEALDGADGQVRVTLDHIHVEIVGADAGPAEVGGTQSTFELVLTEAGWRVRRWHERHAGSTVAGSLSASARPGAVWGVLRPAQLIHP